MFSNNNKYQFDFKDKDGETGFIPASFNKHEKAVDLILANYKELQIDLKIKDQWGQTGLKSSKD